MVATTTTSTATKGYTVKRLPNPVIPDYTPKKERQQVEDKGLPMKPCLICQKLCQPYGMWADGQTCNSVCEKVKEHQPRNTGEPK